MSLTVVDVCECWSFWVCLQVDALKIMRSRLSLTFNSIQFDTQRNSTPTQHNTTSVHS